MKRNIIFTFLIFCIQSSWGQEIKKNTNEFEKIIASDLKSLNIAKSQNDTLALTQVLNNISLNQKLFDTLIVAQINEYLKYTEAYKSHLQFKDSLKVYENNLLNIELQDKLNSKKSISKIDSNQKIYSINSNVNHNFTSNESIPVISATCINNSNYYLKLCISILNENNNSISKFISEIRPKESKDLLNFEELNTISNKKKYYYTVAILYLNHEGNYFYTYNKSDLLNISNNLTLEIKTENNNLSINKLASNSILKEFNIPVKLHKAN